MARSFQQCITDVLRQDIPDLVPGPKGKDGGRDGGVLDAVADAFLLCTVSESVARNLAKNLDSYLSSGGAGRRVILATSRALTLSQREDLKQIAGNKGFVLLPPFEQGAVADRLYYRSQWCKDLLGLAGTPSALSIVPVTKRPLLELEPVGREPSIEWLGRTGHDRLILGQPGSGMSLALQPFSMEIGS